MPPTGPQRYIRAMGFVPIALFVCQQERYNSCPEGKWGITQMAMATGVYATDFAVAFSKLLEKANTTCYQISQYTGLDQGYLSRLKSGEKGNPSLQTLIKIGLALASLSNKIKLSDFEELFNSVSRSLIPKGSFNSFS